MRVGRGIDRYLNRWVSVLGRVGNQLGHYNGDIVEYRIVNAAPAQILSTAWRAKAAAWSPAGQINLKATRH